MHLHLYSYLLYFRNEPANWFSGNLGEINKIDQKGLKDPQPGWFSSHTSNILPFFCLFVAIWVLENKLTHTFKLWKCHIFITRICILSCTSAFFILSNPLTFKIQRTTTSTTFKEIFQKWDLRKTKASKGRVKLVKQVWTFTECNYSITILQNVFLGGSISSLDYLLWKYIFQYQCISQDNWVCTVCSFNYWSQL